MAKTIALDFDGVINSYTSGFIETRIPDPPVPGALAFIMALQNSGHTVAIYSCRASNAKAVELIRTYLKMHGLDERCVAAILITNRKPPAGVYIDDRGYRFTGSFPTIDEVDEMAWQPGKVVDMGTEVFGVPVKVTESAQPVIEPRGSVEPDEEPVVANKPRRSSKSSKSSRKQSRTKSS